MALLNRIPPSFSYNSVMKLPTLLQRGLWLEYATLSWNVVGSTVVNIMAAFQTGSVVLAGFGLDSLIEIFASVIVIWQLKGIEQGRESLSLRLIGVALPRGNRVRVSVSPRQDRVRARPDGVTLSR